MSLSTVVHCNTLHGYGACARSLITGPVTHDEALAIASAHGWRRSGGKDYCPGCSGVKKRPRLVLPDLDLSAGPPTVTPLGRLIAAGETLLPLVNAATSGRWSYQPPTSKAATDGPPGAEIIRGGPRGTEFVARTGPARHPQGAADAAYIACVDPDVGRATVAVLHEVRESVAQEGGLVESSTSQAAVDLADAILRHTP